MLSTGAEEIAKKHPQSSARAGLGSAWSKLTRPERPASGGLWAVLNKELGDHFSSTRFIILFLLVVVTGISASYVAAQSIRQTVGEGEATFVFLRLFTTSGTSLPPFTSFVSFLGPLVGLAMGFDAVNSERARGTLSRLLAQPIHRDDVINGKFLAGLVMLIITLFSLGLVVAGLGLTMTGVPPTTEEALRVIIFLAVSVVYVAFWLALSTLFSLIFRQAATSALGAIAVWLFFAIFASLLAGLAADSLFPVSDQSPVEQLLRHDVWQQNLSRFSPTVLYDEATATLLSPNVRTLGPVLIERIMGAIPGPMPLGQSLLLIWPHLTSLVAATVICFGAAYLLFMRQEIRAT